MRPVHRSLAIALPAALLCGAAGQAHAQTANVRVAGRVQVQFADAAGDSTSSYRSDQFPSSSFEIRRLRIQADVRIGENVNLVIQPSFEMGTLRMRDAYLRVLLLRSATSGLGLTLGQEKKPANRYTLTSSNTLPSIERGLRIRGLLTPVIAQFNLLEENGFNEHDIGVSVDGYALSSRLVAKVGVYNGSGESNQDVNDAKSFGARLVGTVIQDAEARPVLRLGASVMSRDRPVTTTATSLVFAPDSSHRSTAWGLELEYGDFRPGFHVIADLATGEALSTAALCPNGAAFVSCRFDGPPRNFGGLRPNAPDSAFTTFRSFQVIASWRWQAADPSGTALIKIVEPALRVDMTDPNTGGSGDAALLITPVINVHFSQTTVMRAGLDLYRYHDAAGAEHSLRAFRVSWQTNF